VPLLALATALAKGEGAFTGASMVSLAVEGLLALVVVLAIGRWLLRPLFYEIAHSRLRELFTLTVLLVVLSCAWITQRVGLSMALGAFLAGMMLAETEYRHQVESAVRPFRELLLGLSSSRWACCSTCGSCTAIPGGDGTRGAAAASKSLLVALVTRMHVGSNFKALRASLVLAGGGEFGWALLTILVPQTGSWTDASASRCCGDGPEHGAQSAADSLQPAHRAPGAGREGPTERPGARACHRGCAWRAGSTSSCCGFGRVGQNIARVWSPWDSNTWRRPGPGEIRLARNAGDNVVFGDSADEELLRQVGLDTASAVIITFASPAVSVGIARAVRRLRADVPLLVRTQDDAGLAELMAAGVTEVVPETFEASLMLVPGADAVERAGRQGDAYRRGHTRQPLRDPAPYLSSRWCPRHRRFPRVPGGAALHRAAARRLVGGPIAR